MRKLLTIILTTLALYTNAKIVYVDYNDASISTGPNGGDIYIDIDRDGTSDLQFQISYGSGSQSCKNTNGSTVTGNPFVYYASGLYTATYGIRNRLLTKSDCTGDTVNHIDDYYEGLQLATRVGNAMCSGKAGSYKLGFRLTKKNPTNNVNGFIYGYVDYSLTTSGDLIVHGWYYNDAFNEPIIANSNTPYPYNGCVYQDTIKTYVKVNVYDTVKIPKTVYDTIKITKIEIVKKTVYDTIKVEKIIHKTICDSTVLVTVNDTVTKTIYDTIKTHVTINDTIHKTIYTNVKVKVYDTITVPIAVHDTLIVKLGNKTEQKIRLWPNPTSQTLNIDLSNSDNAEITIIDQAGSTITQHKTNTQLLTIELGQWSEGTYTIIVTQNNNTITKHIQIIR